MEKTSQRLQELIQRYLKQKITNQQLFELLGYAQDPLFESEIKEELALLFEKADPQALAEDEQSEILRQIFKKKD
ncbi:hypothetical protein [Pedobacter chitinilyticus]|uniref:Uncharacterized protein n=1 Tax=Pedobacter chitinilyticus TaxID=2233776 RepID=A0A443YIV8_9SPHI|nr:hypothetical protein [Pedobacter chitinilyticus]RWU03687.1 hypothetical protein DPV69_20655 [Pedobacter chitinilyticus]